MLFIIFRGKRKKKKRMKKKIEVTDKEGHMYKYTHKKVKFMQQMNVGRKY